MTRRRRTVLLAIGALALFGLNSVAPDAKWVGVVEDLVSAGAVVGLWIGTRAQPRPNRPPWVLVSIALTCWVVGDFAWDAYTLLGIARPDVSIADVWYLVAYPVLAFGLYRMARARAGAYLREGVLDGCIFGLAAMVVAWQVLVIPISASTPSKFTAVVWSAYPVGDALLVAAVAWLIFAPGRRSTPSLLLFSAMFLTLTVDVLYAYLPTVTTFDTGRLDPFYPIAYWLLAAAALHPANAELVERAGATTRMHPARIVLLGCAVCTTPAVALLANASSSAHRIVFLSLAFVLGLAVVARFAIAVRTRESAQTQLEYQSTHDDLTGVVNRVLLMDRVAHALERSRRNHRPVAVLYVDLDRFKAINDTLGHEAGDEVLRTVTARMRDALRPDDLLGRWGGDEFVVLLPTIALEQALLIADRVRRAISSVPIALSDGRATTITASVGCAITTDETIDGVLGRADSAMYDAKRSGDAVGAAAA